MWGTAPIPIHSFYSSLTFILSINFKVIFCDECSIGVYNFDYSVKVVLTALLVTSDCSIRVSQFLQRFYQYVLHFEESMQVPVSYTAPCIYLVYLCCQTKIYSLVFLLQVLKCLRGFLEHPMKNPLICMLT